MLALGRPQRILRVSVLLLLFAVIGAICALRMQSPFVTMVDDAFIFMRYARNLAEGFGFVWNPGETPVEGYTSFTYLVLLAGLAWTGLPLAVTVQWLGVIAAVGVLVLTWRLARAVNPGHDSRISWS